MAVVNEANPAGFVNDDLSGKTTELEEFDLLAVKFQNPVFGIGQTDELQIFLFPVFLECFGVFRTGHENFRIQFCEFFIIPAQLRHVRAAEGSNKAAVENEHNVFFVDIAGKGYALAVEIIQRKIRRLNIQVDSGHDVTP